MNKGETAQQGQCDCEQQTEFRPTTGMCMREIMCGVVTKRIRVAPGAMRNVTRVLVEAQTYTSRAR